MVESPRYSPQSKQPLKLITVTGGRCPSDACDDVAVSIQHNWRRLDLPAVVPSEWFQGETKPFRCGSCGAAPYLFTLEATPDEPRTLK